MMHHLFRLTLLLTCALFIGGCASSKKDTVSAGESVPSDGKSVSPPVSSPAADGGDVSGDDFDEIEMVVVHDPVEALNRATFHLNHGIYTVILRPVANTYKFLIPKPVRTGVHNVYENIRYPIRVVNHSLQGKFDRAGRETGRFLLDSTVGLAGWFRPSKKFSAIADVPAADTGQTFAKWGIGHGPYLVIPIIGPSSTRDFVGLAGDYALNPLSWATFVFGGAAWTLAITTPNTARSLPDQLDQYDAVTKEALDRYLAARTSYIQYRNAAAKR